MAYYLVNGGSPLKNINFELLRRISVKSPSRDFQIVEHSNDNVFNLLATWFITTPFVSLIYSDDEIKHFDGNIIELGYRPILDYVEEINVLFLSF